MAKGDMMGNPAWGMLGQNGIISQGKSDNMMDKMGAQGGGIAPGGGLMNQMGVPAGGANNTGPYPWSNDPRIRNLGINEKPGSYDEYLRSMGYDPTAYNRPTGNYNGRYSGNGIAPGQQIMQNMMYKNGGQLGMGGGNGERIGAPIDEQLPGFGQMKQKPWDMMKQRDSMGSDLNGFGGGIAPSYQMYPQPPQYQDHHPMQPQIQPHRLPFITQ